jgi:NAD(P)-dependent dehydrogenase (short-subunit alcohol dehydrogenase family)
MPDTAPRPAEAAFVVGAGDFTGAAVARRFAREGFVACVARRQRHVDQLDALVSGIAQDGGRARAFGLDARLEEEVVATVDRIEREVGPIGVFVHNIGANVRFDIVDTTARVYLKTWELAGLSAFLTAREVAARMIPRGRGTMIFTGATASVRGAAGFAAFAGAMHAKRALAQSMARELGPKGIHVAHVVVDGPIDTDFTRQRLDLMKPRPAEAGLLEPAAIAEIYWQIHRQPKSAWTFEMDLRPWAEPW